MTTLHTVIGAGIIMVFAVACKKKPEKGPDTKQDRELKEEKIAFYKSKGFNYLLSINKGQSDSVKPIFFGKTNTGDVKCIFGEYKNGTVINTAKIFNENFINWNLQGLDLSKVKLADDYSLDHKDLLVYESAYNSKPYYYYLEKNGLKPANKWTTEIGDSLRIKFSQYGWNSAPTEMALNDLFYKHETFTINEPAIFRGSLFDYNGLAYLTYYKPREHNVSSTWADIYLMIRSKNGQVFQRDLYTDQLAVFMDGKLETYIEGLNARLIETGAADPIFMFWSDWNSMNQKNVSFWSSFKTEDIFNVMFPYPALQMKFFSYKGRIYANTENELFVVGNAKPVSVTVELKLDNIKGVFGNSRAVLVVVENEEKGLDIVELEI